jgi:ketosteroid isomerase-like protein
VSRENAENARGGFEAYAAGNIDEALAHLDPEIVYKQATAATSVQGRDAVRAAWERWESGWDEIDMTSEEIIDAGDRVIHAILFRGRGRGSGIEVAGRFSRSTRCATERRCAGKSSPNDPRPSKPPGCGSRRGESRYALLAAATCTRRAGSARFLKTGNGSYKPWPGEPSARVPTCWRFAASGHFCFSRKARVNATLHKIPADRPRRARRPRARRSRFRRKAVGKRRSLRPATLVSSLSTRERGAGHEGPNRTIGRARHAPRTPPGCRCAADVGRPRSRNRIGC